jgi:hypothetical protein
MPAAGCEPAGMARYALAFIQSPLLRRYQSVPSVNTFQSVLTACDRPDYPSGTVTGSPSNTTSDAGLSL